MDATTSLWLLLPLLAYAAGCLYFARLGLLENQNGERFFSAGHGIAPWISALLLAGSGLSGWFLLAGTADIAAHGFSLAGLLVGGIALALPGVVLFKRLWLVGCRLHVAADAELLRRYFGSDFLALASAIVSVLIAIGFAGLQMRALSQMLATLLGGTVSPPVASALLTGLLFAYVAIGGLRAIAYIGAVQTVLLAFATLVLAGVVLISQGGFGALNAALHTLAADPAGQARFLVSGVLDFTPGLGRGAGFEPTAMASFGMFLSLVGLGASPLAIKIVLATRNPTGVAAGQTFVVAGVFGGLVVSCIAIIGAGGLVDPKLSIAGILAWLAVQSPWFAGWLLVGLVAGTQVISGLGLVVSAEALVRHLYKPLMHSDLSRADTTTLTRIVAALLALAGVLLQALAPVSLSALAGVALPLSLQLLPPFVGIAWLNRLTREGAVVGVGLGFAAVLLTEPLGHAILSFLGLELPWGRWPWTLPSAIWGLTANLVGATLVSAATQRRPASEERNEIRRFLATSAAGKPTTSGLRSTAYAALLAWLFLAVGPGLLFGNRAFGDFELGMPSLWAWMVAFWTLGFGLVWFLAYKLNLAASGPVMVEPYQGRVGLRRGMLDIERQRRHRFAAAAAILFGLIVFTAFAFG